MIYNTGIRLMVLDAIGKIERSSPANGYILKQLGLVSLGDIKTIDDGEYFIRYHDKYKVKQVIKKSVDGEEVIKSEDTNYKINDIVGKVVVECYCLGGDEIIINDVVPIKKFLEGLLE